MLCEVIGVHARLMILNLYDLRLIALILLCCWVGMRLAAEDTSSYASQEAQFAVAELRKLSDSGVYESLSLDSLLSYSFKDMSYHDSTSLKLSLTSPYFKSGKKSEILKLSS